ncbi:MAG: cytochrome b subunit of succinate dehydrogenase, Sdh3p [Tremellales sp. Tagirdzhanova-0007]|nr:MAG: cytochrome b subunit of succinate dehydrogenase, Sdh3p [Tremellales sp. Tagirdzhanova-0007]
MAASFISRSSVFRSVGIGKCYFPPDTTVPFMDVARSVKHNNPDVIAAPTLRSSRPHLILTARRFAATTSITPPDNMAILNEQRKSRPQSPHLTIYQPQVTWILSSANRITGVFLSGALYGASMLYLLHPVFPSFDSASLVQLAHDMPTWLKGGLKFLFVVPFTFHTFNGIRHLAWDTGYGLSLKGVYVGGYTVLAVTAVSSLYLAFFT